jgi:hypothetical protein
MDKSFTHGYAVVIGVDENNIPGWALPTVAKDVQAVHDVLVHPERCAYKPEHVKLLKGADSTRDNIMEALYWLQEKVAADAEATAVIYYSGHGTVDKNTNRYYLIPYDIPEKKRLRAKAIPADTLKTEIGAVQAKRLLVILDCCHAAGMGAKNAALADPEEEQVQPAPFPHEILKTENIPDPQTETGSKAASELSDGEGRAVLNSSTGAQQSFVRRDGQMSLFTYHLIEALTGYAPHADDATVVYVTDVMSWVTHKVKQSAEQEGRDQTPMMHTTGVFPVAQLIGGKGLSKGLGDTPPDPLAPLPPTGTTFNQQGQQVAGNQFNFGENANIDHIGDKIDTGGGDYVAGTKVGDRGVAVGGNVGGSIITGDGNTVGDTVYGDKVGGDKVAGDKISVGDITDSTGIAIGRGASANVRQGLSGAELTRLFAPLLVQVAQEQPTAVSQVHALKTEAGKGEDADDEKMADLVTAIADAAPSAVEGLVNLFTNAVVAKAAGAATKYVLKRLGR